MKYVTNYSVKYLLKWTDTTFYSQENEITKYYKQYILQKW